MPTPNNDHRSGAADDNDIELSQIRLVADWLRREAVVDQSRKAKLTATAKNVAETIGLGEFDAAFEKALAASPHQAANDPRADKLAALLPSILEHAAQELAQTQPDNHDFWEIIGYFAASVGDLPPNRELVRSCLRQLGKSPMQFARDGVLRVFQDAGEHAMVDYLLNPNS